MVTQSCGPPASKPSPPTQAEILRVRHGDRCLSTSSAQQYLQWIGRFRRYCGQHGLDEVAELTLEGVGRFQAWYARSRKLSISDLGLASSSMRSLRLMGEEVIPACREMAKELELPGPFEIDPATNKRLDPAPAEPSATPGG